MVEAVSLWSRPPEVDVAAGVAGQHIERTALLDQLPSMRPADPAKVDSVTQLVPELPAEQHVVAYLLSVLRCAESLTTSSVVERFRPNLEDSLADARPGSVVLVIGGTGGDYPNVYETIGDLARKAGFSRKAEGLSVSCSDAGMNELVHSERARFYRHLKDLAGDLSDGDPSARKVKEHCEGEHCRVGGGAPQGWPPSAAQTARTVFP